VRPVGGLTLGVGRGILARLGFALFKVFAQRGGKPTLAILILVRHIAK